MCRRSHTFCALLSLIVLCIHTHIRTNYRLQHNSESSFRFLRNIERDILKDMVLKGVHGIQKVFMREDRVHRYDAILGEFPRRDKRELEWVLDTAGCNLEEVLQIEEIDSRRTTSNDIVEIMQVQILILTVLVCTRITSCDVPPRTTALFQSHTTFPLHDFSSKYEDNIQLLHFATEPRFLCQSKSFSTTFPLSRFWAWRRCGGNCTTR